MRVEKNGTTIPVTGVYVETGWHESELYERKSRKKRR